MLVHQEPYLLCAIPWILNALLKSLRQNYKYIDISFWLDYIKTIEQ